ncbi:MAG: UvrD-helicase domain-containing protein [Lachnospiraceae bacterium]|nr:UvrD-helicase domain-containing protein [Lachnospiraceae bacterium]
MADYSLLNDMQREAVFQTEGPVLCLAGAGSGKTRMLTHRVAYLLEKGVEPYHIMAITFTNKAAGEMKERVEKLVGPGGDSLWITTFHSSCVRILRRFADRIGYENSFSIYDTDDSKSVMKDVCKRLRIDTKILKERTILSAISSAKDSLIGPEEFRSQSQGDFKLSRIAEAYVEYQKALKENNAMDFDDLIMQTVSLFRQDAEVLDHYQKRFRYIMVDEYQDTNTAQFELIRLLAEGSRNLCVVGDDDQSIYKFRGANIRNILDFEKHYPEAKVIRLEQNYRSTQNILDAANAVIANNRGRKEKSLWTKEEAGALVHFRQFDTAPEEAEFIADEIVHKGRKGGDFGDFAVLYRTNAQSRLLEERFVREGIPYKVVGGVNFYSRREIKDILAYLKTISNARDDLQVRRIINVPKRGIGATTIAKIQDYADAYGLGFYQALEDADRIPGLGKAAAKIAGFTNQITVFRTKLTVMKLSELVGDILDDTGYLSEFDNETDEEIDDRIDNIEELRNKIIAFEESNPDGTLADFLNEVALVAEIDEVDESVPRTLLMTIHSAKGLEFTHVYLAGMEDGLFPSDMTVASEDPMELEEERRLAYVGITRAKKELTITCAKARMIRGETHYNAISRFVREIPTGLLDNRVPGAGRIVSKDEDEPYDDPTERFDMFRRSPYGGNYGSGRNGSGASGGFGSGGRPKAVVRKKSTPDEVKPYLAGGGTGSFERLGISKGMPKPSGTAAGSGSTPGAKPDYGIGDRVAHIKYGEGTVTDLEPGPRDYKVTVDFDEYGTKVMYAAFAKLIRLDD